MTRRALLIATSSLALAAAVAVAASAPRDPERAAASVEFQHLVGGLGLGRATDLDRCAHEFDPRLDPRCPGDFDPTPGGAAFCPHHPPWPPRR